MIIIHVVFVGSGVLLALMDYISQNQKRIKFYKSIKIEYNKYKYFTIF